MISIYGFPVVLFVLTVVFFLIEKNDYSVGIFSILSMAILIGLSGIIEGHSFWRPVLFIVAGILMGMNLKGPESTTQSASKKVWLLTFRGRATTVVVERLTLVLDWPVDIVGAIEFDLKQVDENFPLKKPILCLSKHKGITGAYVYGLVSATMQPDYESDKRGTQGGLKGGKKLQLLANAGGIPGILTQLDDMLTATLQSDFGNFHDTTWMERETKKISGELYKKIVNGGLYLNKPLNSLGNASGFGVKFIKLQVLLSPEPEVIAARNDYLIELAQRDAELADTKTMNLRTSSIIDDATDKGYDIEYLDARSRAFNEGISKAGKYEVQENKGGVNVTTREKKGK